MMNTLDILEMLRARVRERTGSATDYRIAKEVGCVPSAVYGWKKRRSIESNYAIKIAHYCDVPAAWLVACVEAEKAKDPEARAFWEDLAREFQPEPLPPQAEAA